MTRTLLTLTLLLTYISPSFADDIPKTRLEFYEAFWQLKKKHTQAEIKQILGEPDCVLRVPYTGGVFDKPQPPGTTRETWKYGTSVPKGLALQGQIRFDQHRNILEITGRRPPIPDGIIPEKSLHKLLLLIHDSGKAETNRTGKLIEVVNAIQSLGKEKSLLVLKEYLRLTTHLDEDWDSEKTNTFFIMRVLYNLEPDHRRYPETNGDVIVLTSQHDENKVKGWSQLLPRDPVVIIGDVPYVLPYISGDGIGVPFTPEMNLRFYQKFGRIREQPLQPVPDPVRAIQQYVESPQWFFDDNFFQFEADKTDDWDTVMKTSLHTQCLTLLGKLDDSKKQTPEEIQKLFASVQGKKFQWDSEQFKYVEVTCD